MSRSADWRICVAIGGATGLAISPWSDPGGGWLRAALALALVTAVLVERGRAGWAAVVPLGVAAALAGMLTGAARIEAIDSGALSAAPGSLAATGQVLEVPSESRGVARFALATGRGDVLVEADPEEAGELTPGAEVAVSGQVGPAPNWMRADLERRGIRSVLRSDRVERLPGRRGGIAGAIDRLRDRADLALGAAVPDREAALSRGFVLGNDNDIDEQTVDDFRASGLSHLLAVSGQNIVLLALLAIPFLSLLGVGPRARLLAIGALILVYVPLAGGGPSIQRAGVMGIAGLVAAGATRAPSRTYALAVAALITLGLNPRATGDIGWQLSFAAVLGIMVLARPIQERLGLLIGREGWRGALSEGTAVTLAATIATAPLTVLHFERFPIPTLVANLAAMPAVAPAMWLGMISIAVGQVSPALAIPFNLAGSLFLAWIAQVAEWFGRPGWAAPEVKIAPTVLLALSLALGAAVYGALRFWPAGRPPERSLRKLSALALILAGATLLLPGLLGTERRHLEGPPPGGARVEVLDVGQGDAILIRPRQADPILVDGGPPGGDLRGALESADVERLEAVILTHPDLDHYGGLMELFGRLPVHRLLFDRAPAELISLARVSGAALRRIAEGDTIRDGNVVLELLWPPPDDGPPVQSAGSDADTNSRSIVVLLRFRGFRMLLTGDAEAETVPMDPGPLDVLKVSHHGSEDTGLATLLDRTGPSLAVISVGDDNPYGHPVPEVLRALAEERTETARTDRDGSVSIVLDGNGWRVESGE